MPQPDTDSIWLILVSWRYFAWASVLATPHCHGQLQKRLDATAFLANELFVVGQLSLLLYMLACKGFGYQTCRQWRSHTIQRQPDTWLCAFARTDLHIWEALVISSCCSQNASSGYHHSTASPYHKRLHPLSHCSLHTLKLTMITEILNPTKTFASDGSSLFQQLVLRLLSVTEFDCDKISNFMQWDASMSMMAGTGGNPDEEVSMRRRMSCCRRGPIGLVS